MLWEEGVMGGGCYGRRVLWGMVFREEGVGGWCCGRRVLGDGVMGGKSVQIQMCSVVMYY